MTDNKNAYHIGACEIVITRPTPSMPYSQYNLVVGEKRIRGQITCPSVDDVLQAVSNAKRDHLITEEEKANVVRSLKGQIHWGPRLVSVDIAKIAGSQTGRGGGKFLQKRPVRQVAIVEEVEEE